ncbi:site-specific tyrosine recombinase XerD [Posidoniimonas corsicana]|uniref:Site-specific tyrosine recombinase XerD n=1 Tax=Posidoniimonas corsicana TaxID=1938618 RepID=A0A5C5VAI3_9BACT|nr:tyrosine-type recombinase/integrase [Posidoniimonas corsicana]TWT35606.1 site-specific tyrosine recombinase XerD [Posidoniimonas corsicana]
MATKTAPIKPSKPYSGFPLTAHPCGQWAKKIKGKIYYFGVWADPDAAVRRFLEERDDLFAGRRPRSRDSESIDLHHLCNLFLNHNQARVERNELTELTWNKYFKTAKTILATLGRGRTLDSIGPADFSELHAAFSAETSNPHTLGSEVTRTRTIFNYAMKEGLTEKNIRFGIYFSRPKSRVYKAHRRSQNPKLLSAQEIWKLLDAAKYPFRAFVLLGINCGFGNTDCGKLPVSAIDVDRKWISFPRPKTEIERDCPLWPETIEAIQAGIDASPAPASEEVANLAFRTKYGKSWAASSSLSSEYRKLAERVGVYRPNVTFYALRHTFATIGGDVKDQIVVDRIMGHSDNSMAGAYRETISEQRFWDVANHVRDWLMKDRDI